jgi:superfamily II DNA helicase RecQ
LLIAKTGFGKSIIFPAFSILTRKITLQLIPLTKLGDEQLNNIKRLNSARPCLINKDTRREEEKLLFRVTRGDFTYVLLGPEQASNRGFRNILKSTELQGRIGLVAIDECHLIPFSANVCITLLII